MPRARHTSCASSHFSGEDGAIFFWKSAICTDSVLSFLFSSRYVLYGGSLSFAVFYLPLALINPAVYCFSVSKVE